MEKRDDKPVQIVQRTDHEHKSLEVSMLEKDDFSDEELESYLSKGEIKATDKVTIPPKYFSLETVPLPLLVISVLQQVRQKAKRLSTFQQW